jgi:hypothetical protein
MKKIRNIILIILIICIILGIQMKLIADSELKIEGNYIQSVITVFEHYKKVTQPQDDEIVNYEFVINKLSDELISVTVAHKQPWLGGNAVIIIDITNLLIIEEKYFE